MNRTAVPFPAFPVSPAATEALPETPEAMPRRGRNEALALALDATLTSIWDYEVTGNVVALDKNWSRMRGGPAQETTCTIRHLFSLLHPEDRPRAAQATLACITGKTEDYSQEYRVRDHHGHWIWVHSRGRVMRRDADGRASRMIGTNIDISQRKTSELAAVRQLDFLQALNQTTLALLQQRAKSEILESLAGYSAALLESARVEVALIEGEELVAHACGGQTRAASRARAGRREAILSWRAIDARQPVTADGPDHLREVASAYHDASYRSAAIFPILLGGRCLGVLAFLRDGAGAPFSSEEKEKGMALAQLAALVIHNATIYEDAVSVADSRTTALRESEAQFKGVFDGSPIPIILLDLPDGRIRAVNRACEETFGYRAEEAIGRTTLELNVWPDLNLRQALLEQVRTGGVVRPLEVEMRRKDGGLLTALYSVARLVIAGQPCLLASVIDITAQKQAEAALKKSESRLRQAQKMESLGALAGGIAHDFNNILTGILGYAQLALSDLEPTHPAAQWLEGILKSGDRAKNLVHQILTFSRKTESARCPVRLPALAQESLALLR
ncbi:MAG TPA: PAS domain S-box protein, partial [Lacunisphaera sp.]|nr:PAS domain S-box protein [Lacunisphaera sp.]